MSLKPEKSISVTKLTAQPNTCSSCITETSITDTTPTTNLKIFDETESSEIPIPSTIANSQAEDKEILEREQLQALVTNLQRVFVADPHEKKTTINAETAPFLLHDSLGNLVGNKERVADEEDSSVVTNTGPSNGAPLPIMPAAEYAALNRTHGKIPLPSWCTKFRVIRQTFAGFLNATKNNIGLANALSNHVSPLSPYAKCTRVSIQRSSTHIPDGLPDREKSGKVHAEWIDFDNGRVKSRRDKVVLYFHGGVFVICSRKTHRTVTWKIAKYAECRVLSIDYRLSPKHVYPAALHDCISAYFYLIDPPMEGNSPVQRFEPSQIVFSGDSAGGNLAASLMFWLRDHGHPMPGGMALLSPWMDLPASQPSYWLNAPYDYLPDKSADPRFIDPSRCHYYTHDNTNIRQPYISPMYASPNPERRLPPILIQLGDAERLRDECLVFASRFMGQPDDLVQVELYQDMIHVFQMFSSVIPFAKLAMKRLGAWVKECAWAKQSSGQSSRTLHVTRAGEVRVVERPLAIVEEAESLVQELGLRPAAPMHG